MPRAARYKVAEIGALGRQLLYAPPETRYRQMVSAERLASEIDPRQVYPQDFVVYRITGYRPDSAGSPVTLAGAALLGDLATLVQRLSQTLELPAEGDGRTAFPFVEIARRLGVSGKTVQRYRRLGLLCHSVVFPGGSRRLACYEDTLQRFIEGHRDRLGAAAAFSRVEPPTLQAIVREARQLRRRRGLSLSTAARHLAGAHGRAHETVRLILQRHDRRGGDHIFAERGPISPAERAVIWRAASRGIQVASLCRRFGRSRATIHRAINRRRADLLRRLDLAWIELPTMGRADAEAVILQAPAARLGLDELPPRTDALRLIEWAGAAAAAEPAFEDALLGGFNVLKRRAARGIAALAEHPSATSLDSIETDLRWAALLERRLVAVGLPAALGAVEQAIGRPLPGQTTEEILDLLHRAVAVAARGADVVDPGRGQRLAHRCAFMMDRELAVRPPRRAGAHHRAAPLHRPGSIAISDAFAAVAPWQAWLSLRPDLEARLDALADEPRQLLTRRHGLAGEPPQRLADLAAESNMTTGAVADALRRALVMLRRKTSLV